MSVVIEVQELKKSFGRVDAVDKVSFQVNQGELFGFLGENGAGKSTTINMLCTLYKKDGGDAAICGYELGKQDEKIRGKIGVVFQNNTLDNLLTIKQNLIIRSSLYLKTRKEMKENLERVSKLLEIEELLERPFKSLSGGQKRRCEIARALMNQPEIIFLDEPTTGLDPQTRKNVWNIIEILRKEMKMTVFLTTHYMEEAAKADHIAIMDLGKIIEDATPYELKEKYAHDRLLIVPKDREKVMEVLRRTPYRVNEKPTYLSVHIKDSCNSIPVLYEIKDVIDSFEVIKGSMDDVFLNVTGRALSDQAREEELCK